MCLACELDALWYAEREQLAGEGADASGAAGRTSALPEDTSGKAAPSVRFLCEEIE
jgi:hypothetical protein